LGVRRTFNFNIEHPTFNSECRGGRAEKVQRSTRSAEG
jgi:hypothetical protein